MCKALNIVVAFNTEKYFLLQQLQYLHNMYASSICIDHIFEAPHITHLSVISTIYHKYNYVHAKLVLALLATVHVTVPEYDKTVMAILMISMFFR